MQALPPPVVFAPHIDPTVAYGQLAVLALTLGAAAYWWWGVVPSARRSLAKEKRAGAGRTYLEGLQSDPSRRLERWFYTDWLRQLERRQELARSAAAKRAAAAGGGGEQGLPAAQQEQEGAPPGGAAPGEAESEWADREPAFWSLDNPLIATAALVAGAGAAATLARAAAGLVVQYDIPGNDLAGKGGSKYTKVCVPPSGGYKGKSGFDAYKLYCDDTPGCVAAVAPRAPDGCAYLKSKGDRGAMKADPKWVVVTSAEKPQKACTFSNLGGPCTTDPWVDQPICCGGNKNPCMNGVCVSGYPSGRPRTYRFVNGHDIPGNDIASNGEPFTKVCVPTSGGYKGKYSFPA
ncbi:MAG: hypothetical protein J3K34DRAFT_525434 [Monoraphidium minutum]|nr:MAG: hypothetical protein J3K34DRAFT_525434 [Monoraphidium minutum]